MIMTMTIMSGRPALTEGTAARDKSFSVGEVGGQVVQRLTSSWINILMIVMLMLMIVIVVMVMAMMMMVMKRKMMMR